MKRTLAFFTLALIALAVPDCGSGPPPLRIGALYPLSGSLGPGGVDEFRGVQLAVDLANQGGGVKGRRVELIPVDVAAADAAPEGVDGLAAQGVDLVFGSYGSTISAAAGAEAARRGMLFWETGAVGMMTGPGPGRLFFRVAPSGAVLGRTAVQFIAQEVAPRLHTPSSDLRFAVTNVDDVYGNEVAGGALDEIHSEGLAFAGQFPYDPHMAHFAALVREIGASGANVLFVAAYLQDGIAMRREMVRQGLHLLAGIGTSSSYCMPGFGGSLGRDAVGLFASDKPDAEYLNPDALTSTARSVLDRASTAYRSRWSEEMSAPALAGFSAAWALLHTVLPAATSFSPGDVAGAALAADLPQGSLPNGSGLRFGAAGTPQAGENVLATSVVWEWVGVDRRAVVWPPKFATQAILPIEPLP